MLHSRLSPGERYDEWRRIRRGDVRVFIGARSAIFAPLENVGLIIIDEEHEQSYIADNNPHYDARQLAHERCAREGRDAAAGQRDAEHALFRDGRARRFDAAGNATPRQ